MLNIVRKNPSFLTPAGAAGLCFLASAVASNGKYLLEFAVTGEDFKNHFVVDLGNGWVFDPTAPQVFYTEQRGRWIFQLADYPSNYTPIKRTWPADPAAERETFIEKLNELEDADQLTLTTRFALAFFSAFAGTMLGTLEAFPVATLLASCFLGFGIPGIIDKTRKSRRFHGFEKAYCYMQKRPGGARRTTQSAGSSQITVKACPRNA